GRFAVGKTASAPSPCEGSRHNSMRMIGAYCASRDLQPLHAHRALTSLRVEARYRLFDAPLTAGYFNADSNAPATRANPAKAGGAKPRVLALLRDASLTRHEGLQDGRAAEQSLGVLSP